MVRSPSSHEGMPLKAAPTVVCARTSLVVPALGYPLVTTRGSAMRTRYDLTPRRARELDGSRHTSGAKAFAHAPPVGGDLGVGLGDGR